MTSPQTLATVSVDSVLASRWARLLFPSLSDLFFLALLVWLFMSAAGWQALLVDADVGWHIRTGEYILDHHAVPRHDLYSFSKPGAPWYAWEWLSDVIFGSVHRLAGLKGVVLLAGVVIAAFATTLIRRMVWRGVNVFVAILVSLAAVRSAWMHFLARPHIFTLLLLSISVWMLEADRKARSRKIWLLVPLTVVWTNLHGGFLALIAVLGLNALGTVVETWMNRAQWRDAVRYAALAGACMAASLINPYGYKLHVHMAEFLQSDWIRTVIQEFQSPSFRNENMMQFEALLLAGLIAAGYLFQRRRIVEGLWIVFFAHMALQSARHVPVFVTVAAPIIAAEVSRWWRTWSGRAARGSAIGIINQMAGDQMAGFRRSSLWPAIAVIALMLMGSPIPWPKDFPDEIFPVKMVHAHAAEILGAQVMTTDQWGDYLIYTNPQQKVFVDGRSDFYGPEVGNQYLHLMSGYPGWEKVMAKYDFKVVLVPAESALAQLLKQRSEWRIAEDDGKRILLVRSTAPVPPTGNAAPEPRS
jgi:hypothetical protein